MCVYVPMTCYELEASVNKELSQRGGVSGKEKSLLTLAPEKDGGHTEMRRRARTLGVWSPRAEQHLDGGPGARPPSVALARCEQACGQKKPVGEPVGRLVGVRVCT